MKIIIDNKNNIICKTSLINNEDIKEEIKKQIEKMLFQGSDYSNIKLLKHELIEIDIYNKFSVELYKYDNQDMIYIHGDDGLIELEIVEIENIIDL